jgi:hypothetical protein
MLILYKNTQQAAKIFIKEQGLQNVNYIVHQQQTALLLS